jgi:hypothetical protein
MSKTVGIRAVFTTRPEEDVRVEEGEEVCETHAVRERNVALMEGILIAQHYVAILKANSQRPYTPPANLVCSSRSPEDLGRTQEHAILADSVDVGRCSQVIQVRSGGAEVLNSESHFPLPSTQP